MKTRIENGTVIFSATPAWDGQTVRTITFDPSKVVQDLRNYAECLGWQNRIKDNAALAATTVAVTDDMRLNAVQELVTYYESGAVNWSRAAKGTPRAPAQSPAILAIAARKGLTYLEAEKLVNDHFMADLEKA
jgi:hypothetical protein